MRSQPTLEQLESLPVIRCINGILPSLLDSSNELMPQPPENEDDHIETTASNVELITPPHLENDGIIVENLIPTTTTITTISPATNGYIKDVDLADEENEESR